MRVVAHIYFTAGVTSLLSAAVLAKILAGGDDTGYLWIPGILGVLALGTAIGLQKLTLAGWFPAALLSGISFVIAAIEVPTGMLPLPARLAAVVTQGYILLILFSPKGTVVCSSRYRRIVAATPHLKCPTPLLGWIFPGLTVFVILVTLRTIYG